MKKRAIGAVLAVVAAGALALLGWWWTHPTLLSEESLGLGSGSGSPKPVAAAVYHVGVAGRPWRPGRHRETITLHGYQPHLPIDGAALRVSLSVCVPRLDKSGPVVVGIVAGELADYCTEVTPVRDGTTMEVGTREYLVATLTATRPGRSTLSAISVDYSRSGTHLWQHGEDRIEGGFTLRAR